MYTHKYIDLRFSSWAIQNDHDQRQRLWGRWRKCCYEGIYWWSVFAWSLPDSWVWWSTKLVFIHYNCFSTSPMMSLVFFSDHLIIFDLSCMYVYICFWISIFSILLQILFFNFCLFFPTKKKNFCLFFSLSNLFYKIFEFNGIIGFFFLTYHSLMIPTNLYVLLYN